MPDTNPGIEELEDTPANINVVLYNSAAAATHLKLVPHFRPRDPAGDNNQHLRQKSSSAWAIKSCPIVIITMQTMSSK